MNGSIVQVPLEFLNFFSEEPERAVLEYLSIPVGSTNPFFRNTQKIRDAMDRGASRPNPMDENTYVFDKNFVCRDHNPRYMHIDLAINRDAVGISMCHASSFVSKTQRDTKGQEVTVNVPHITFDFTARLKPRSEFGERDMDFTAVLEIVRQLNFERGFNLEDGLVTFDRFQSHMLISQLRDMGIPCALLSVDHTTARLIVDHSKPEWVRRESLQKQPSAAMGSLRDALYEDRIDFPEIPRYDEVRNWLEKEADEIQWDGDKQKAIKMEGGSDDLIQSIAGAVFNCSNNAQGITIPDVHDRQGEEREEEFYSELGKGEFVDRFGDPRQTNDLGFIEDDFSAYGRDDMFGGNTGERDNFTR